jgi:hypothetical protein
VKAKPKAKAPQRQRAAAPRWSERATRLVQARPILTWGTAASIIAIVGGLWTGGAWFFGRFQLVDAAESVIKEIRKDAAAHEKKDAQERIETMYGQQRIETLILRSRVNDCAARTRSLKPIESNICAEYRQEFQDAQKRTEYLYEQVTKAAK